MKKLSTFFLTLLLALVTSSAFATTFDEGSVIQIGEPVTEVQTDQWYALYSMLGGWIYDKTAGERKSQAYWLTDESNLTSGMVANDVKDYLIQLVESSTEGAYYIQYANDNYIYMYPSFQYAWSWGASSTETIVKVEGEETDDIFSIHETEANYCFYTYSGGSSACVSWGTGTVASNWDPNYKYQFYPVEIVDTSVLPEDNDYEIGDQIFVDHKKCTVVGDNLFVNGGFNDGMDGWTAGGYTTAADPDNFDIESEGGYNDGAYLVASSAGTGNEKTPSQAIAVEVGKWYMLVAYTSGKTPDSNNLRYSALFEMSDATTEASHTEGSTTYSNDIITLEWGADPAATTDEWTQTIGVFEATTDYVGMRMGWSGGSYDGFQLYEVEVEEIEPDTIYEKIYECIAEFDHWSINGNSSGSFQLNTWSGETDPSGLEVPFIEYWVGGSYILPDATISHETLNVDNGMYEVSIFARLFNEGSLLTHPSEGITFTANGESVDMTTGTHGTYNLTSNEYYGTYTLVTEVTDGTLDIGFNVEGLTAGDWLAFKDLAVSVMTTTDQIELTAVEGQMDAEIAAAQAAAIAQFGNTLSADDYYAAVAAIEAAEESVEFYTAMKQEIDAVAETLDEAGTAALEASGLVAAYEAGTLPAEGDVVAALVAAVEAQTTEGSDLGYVLANTAWVGQTGTYADGVERYGDEIVVDGDVPVKVLYQSIEGLIPGATYELTFYAVPNNAWVGAAVGDDIAQVFANDQVVDVTVNDQTSCTPSDYSYTFEVTIGEDGVLEYGLQNIATGGNWYVAQAVSLTILDSGTVEPVVPEGEYLIVNAEGNYLGGGLTWGTQAAIIGKPQFIGFEVQANGTYHLDSHQYNNADAHYLGSNLYFDSTPVDWTIAEVDGGYTIYGTVDDGTGYLTSNGFQTVPTVGADPYVWTLLTIEDVIAGMDEATADAPVDVTALIASPELKRNSNTDYHPTWTVTGYDGTGTPSNYAFGGGSAVANCAESYHSTNGFNFSQEITLPLAGTYTLSAKGFYRDDSSETLLLPVLYAGEETSTFPELDTSANNMAEAYAEFLEGLHQIDAITIEAAEDGETVTIGFKGEDTSLWNIMGELELLYLGAEAEGPEAGEVVHECVAEVDHWTIEGNTNGDFHYNDWSVETDASGMVVPFLEYWVWSGEGNLSAATISHETLTDLEAGTYEVSLDVRIFSEAGNDIQAGTTLNANDASVDLWVEGTDGTYGTETEVYGTYTLTATVGEDGTLDICIVIPSGVSYNWIAFKNLSVTYVGEEVVADNSYQFVCTDWSSIDTGRVTNDNISYDEDANTITVNAGTGANNVALSNGTTAPFTTADYTVSSEQNWYVVVASNISTDLSASQLWWMNGANDGGSYTPDYIVELGSGEILIAWDLSATGIDTNLQDDENYLDGWTGFGLTSTTGTSVVSDINFYTWKEAVAKYPELEAIATEIENVETAGTELVKEGIYTLNGVRLNKITKSGIYIVDGKKVLVK